jgi:transposase
VTRTKLDPVDSKLELWIDFAPGARFTCSKCNTGSCPAYDTKQTTWRHLDFFQYRTFLHVRHPRVECPTCGILRVDVPWARPESGFTFLFEAMVMAMAPHMPVAALARQVREHDTRVWRILHYHVNEARARADHSGVHQVGMDETSKGKGHDYVTLFVDLNPLKRRVLYVTPGKDASTVARFAEDFQQHGGDPGAIQDVCMDMSVAFESGVKTSLPDAVITFASTTSSNY